jgi:hypothetical protein
MKAVAVAGGRTAVVVAGRDVHGVALGIDGGLLQIGPPEGPHSCVPTLFFVVGLAGSMV